jgi:hypothetical protein
MDAAAHRDNITHDCATDGDAGADGNRIGYYNGHSDDYGNDYTRANRNTCRYANCATD